MTKEQIIALCIIIGSIVIGIIIFFIGCIYHVKKDTVMVMERMQKFFGLYYKGYYFFNPFLYRRRGVYPLNETKKIIRLNNGKKAEVTYKIIDVMKYHYGDISIEKLFNNLSITVEKVTLEILKKELLNIGIELYNIKPI